MALFGVVGKGMTVATSWHAYYTVPNDLKGALVNILLANQHGTDVNSGTSNIKIAISTSGTPGTADIILTKALGFQESFEVSRRELGPGEIVYVYGDNADVSVRVEAIEQVII